MRENESSKKQATSGWFSADLWRQGKTSWWKFNYTKNARQKLTRTSFSCRKLIYDLSTLHENLHCTGSELFLLPWEKTKNKEGDKDFLFLQICQKWCNQSCYEFLPFFNKSLHLQAWGKKLNTIYHFKYPKIDLSTLGLKMEFIKNSICQICMYFLNWASNSHLSCDWCDWPFP